jgi:glucosylglycerate phosphorylase
MTGLDEQPANGAAIRERLLTQLYGADAPAVARQLEQRLERHRTATARHQAAAWSAADVWLITYADQFTQTSEMPLATLASVLGSDLGQMFTGVHVLPFYPSSSDEGFSVIDYRKVDHAFGTWDDIAGLASDRRLMVDAVVNHVSARSPWFRDFLAGEEPFARFFRTADPDEDTSAVIRPRTHPLLTEFDSATGPVSVWTTFSADQVDLDYRTPEVLLEIIDVLLGYIDRGASAIRLDAAGFLWKDPARSSIHLPETHVIVQFLRSCVDHAAPGTLLITETNVPQIENISYLNQRQPEANAVYQFALAPLVADAIFSGDVETLAGWADGLDAVVATDCSFLNFLACHDGIGLRPAEGLLSPTQTERLVAACQRVGGQVSYRSLPDGSQTPYELNTTWFDFLGDGVDEATAIARHLATHAVMLALPGIPAIYVHSLFGSSNDQQRRAETGENRSLNRTRFVDTEALLGGAMPEAGTRASLVADGLRKLVMRRRTNPAFHPEAPCQVGVAASGVLSIERQWSDARAHWLVNLSAEPRLVSTPSGAGMTTDEVELTPYGIAILS